MKPWAKEWLVLDEGGGTRVVPALTFLQGIRQSAREHLLAIVDAVALTGPDNWYDKNSHRAMRGDLDHLHEARDKHDQTLYRLFLCWQRDTHRVVIIDGREKPNSSALDASEYESIRDLAATLEADPPPLATVDDIVRAALRQQN